MYETNVRSFPASGALGKFRRVILTAGILALAGSNDRDLGTLDYPVLAGEESGSVRLVTAHGTTTCVAAGAVAQFARVYGAAAGKVAATPNGNLVGISLNAATADGDYIEVLRIADPTGRLYAATAASTAISNTAAETPFDVSYSVPAGVLKAGDTLRVRALVSVTGQNSTDTLTVKLKIGTTVVCATAAVDSAVGDVVVIDAEIVVRTDGATGTLIAFGTQGNGPLASAQMRPFGLASTAVDTTVAQAITLTATWSVANAANSCRLDALNVSRAAA